MVTYPVITAPPALCDVSNGGFLELSVLGFFFSKHFVKSGDKGSKRTDLDRVFFKNSQMKWTLHK